MIVDVITVGAFQVNCVLIGDEPSRAAVVVDPGDEGERIARRVEELELKVERVLLTHAHLDHVMGVAPVVEATGASVWLHAADRDLYDHIPQQAQAFAMQATPPPAPSGELVEGQTVDVGGLSLEVLHTPGHSPGGVSLVWRGDDGDGLVLPGDTLFARGIGRTDLWGGDFKTLIGSIQERLLTLPAGYRVVPGHGPETTIGDEARFNPFLTDRGFL